ncbi:hypothetical protein B0H13DRAFT_1650266, partial [Mycena leptocephala]
KLKTITQSSAYRIIRMQKMESAAYQETLDRPTTSKNTVYAQDAATDSKGEAPSVEQVWRSVRNKDISRSIRFFLWMVIHEGYALGDRWKHFSGYEDRGECKHCGIPEDIGHILTRCDASGQDMAWDLVSELLHLETGAELRPTMGEIIACRLIEKGTTANAGTTRLFRIVVSESAHLI